MIFWNLINVTVFFFIIMIITRHQLGLDRPVSASSNSLFKGLPIRLSPFGTEIIIISDILLLLYLLHVVASVICIFLVSRQLVRLPVPPNFFFIHFVIKEGVAGCSYEKFQLYWC